MPNESTPAAGEFLLYQTEDGQTRIECCFETETIWLSRPLMPELFQTTPQNITLHLKAIYQDTERDEAATSKDYLLVQQEGALSETPTTYVAIRLPCSGFTCDSSFFGLRMLES